MQTINVLGYVDAFLCAPLERNNKRKGENNL